MYTIECNNVSEGFYLAVDTFRNSQKVKENRFHTRNGWVTELSNPCCVIYNNPTERVLFYPERDANPFFHLMESLWMLRGRNDVKWISWFNKRMLTYSDNGDTLHGAYGHRWKHWFGKDQLEIIAKRLTTYENDRRCVLTMWDPEVDLLESNQNVDLPCNTQIFFKKRKNILDMTVMNRSNDLIWGCFGANVVHMSFLLEYMCAKTNSGMGKYYQITNNLHAYEDEFKKVKDIQPEYDPYVTRLSKDSTRYVSWPLVDNMATFDQELEYFISASEDKDSKSLGKRIKQDFKNSFFWEVAEPLYLSWLLWKNKSWNEAVHNAQNCRDKAWAMAAVEWLFRREPK